MPPLGCLIIIILALFCIFPAEMLALILCVALLVEMIFMSIVIAITSIAKVFRRKKK